jgi:hypothetical protein
VAPAANAPFWQPATESPGPGGSTPANGFGPHPTKRHGINPRITQIGADRNFRNGHRHIGEVGIEKILAHQNLGQRMPQRLADTKLALARALCGLRPTRLRRHIPYPLAPTCRNGTAPVIATHPSRYAHMHPSQGYEQPHGFQNIRSDHLLECQNNFQTPCRIQTLRALHGLHP